MAERSSLDTVTELLGKSPERSFPESVELAVNLKEVDLTVPKNRIEEEIQLPNGRGRSVRVAIFGTPEMCQKIRGVADVVIASSELDEVVKDKRSAKKLAGEVDFFLAEAPLMPTIGKRLGVVLGPRGKMPRPVPPGSDPTNLIRAMQRSVRIRSKSSLTLHAPVGTRAMPPEAIAGNIDAVLARIVARLERGRSNIASVYLKTSMGPSVRYW